MACRQHKKEVKFMLKYVLHLLSIESPRETRNSPHSTLSSFDMSTEESYVVIQNVTIVACRELSSLRLKANVLTQAHRGVEGNSVSMDGCFVPALMKFNKTFSRRN